MTDKAFTKRFGEWLRMRRVALVPAVSQAELGAAIGVSDSAISGWENGRSLPNALLERKLKRFLDGREAAMPAKSSGRLRHG